jgi:hypothetical protein
MPPGGKAAEALRIQKEARQKKMLIALAPVLLALLAWQGPATLKAFSGGSKPAEPAAQQPAEGETPADPTGGAPSTAAPAPPAAQPVAVGLADTDTVDASGPGQLVSFSRFTGKDPFFQQVTAKEPVAGSAPPPSVTPSPGGGTTTTPTTPTTPAAPTSAVLDVNGKKQTVALKGTFPQSDPIFRLAKVSNTRIEIGLVSGSFTNGVKTIEVRRGRTVTLVSQPDGVRYVITFVSVPDTTG